MRIDEGDIVDTAFRKLHMHTAFNNRGDENSIPWGRKLWVSYGFELTSWQTYEIIDEQKFILFLLEWS